MNLQRQAERPQAGYAMAALLTILAVMSILLTAALPVWRHEMRREKEAELVFRGEQYVRAIYLFQRRFPGTYPPNVDVLVEQKFLRKKYKDPITGDDFALLRVGMMNQQQRPGGGQQQQPSATPIVSPQGPGGSRLPEGGAGALGGVVGVASKSTADSIRIYQGRTKYNQWPFVYAGAAGQPGGPGQQRPGMPGVGGPRRPGQGPPPRPGQGPRPGGPAPRNPGAGPQPRGPGSLR